MSAPKIKKNAPSGESENQRLKHRKGKLIRLDDLIPKQDVKGGRQLFRVPLIQYKQQSQQRNTKFRSRSYDAVIRVYD